MADFCQQCSIEAYGEDGGDFVGKEESWLVVCEGCGPIQVDEDGKCLSHDFSKAGHPVFKPRPFIE